MDPYTKEEEMLVLNRTWYEWITARLVTPTCQQWSYYSLNPKPLYITPYLWGMKRKYNFVVNHSFWKFLYNKCKLTWPQYLQVNTFFNNDVFMMSIHSMYYCIMYCSMYVLMHISIFSVTQCYIINFHVMINISPACCFSANLFQIVSNCCMCNICGDKNELWQFLFKP